MVSERLGWYKGVHLILSTSMEDKNSKLVRKGSVLKSSAANTFG